MKQKSAPEDIFSFLNEHIPVTRETFDRLSIYYDLLLKWQKRINLVSTATLEDAWRRHFLDSLQLLDLIPDLSSILIDLGSGAGFPGLALAIAGAKNAHLIESDSKKIAFLREVSRATCTDVCIHHQRVESVILPKAEIITARACASLDELLNLSSKLLSRETICLFPKGKKYSKEIEDAKKHWEFNYRETPSITDSEGIILKLTDIKGRDHDRHQRKG
ncbi:MAG: 16S rRNA (guanine(527)-N(7))-methyltransferase RsmG [Pseudomonadota bacterium]|nr:16S rRNA (guanine(527)-N(7))-methyltransferase RsmG [Pseudomonadota bacterium]